MKNSTYAEGLDLLSKIEKEIKVQKEGIEYLRNLGKGHGGLKNHTHLHDAAAYLRLAACYLDQIPILRELGQDIATEKMKEAEQALEQADKEIDFAGQPDEPTTEIDLIEALQACGFQVVVID